MYIHTVRTTYPPFGPAVTGYYIPAGCATRSLSVPGHPHIRRQSTNQPINQSLWPTSQPINQSLWQSSSTVPRLVVGSFHVTRSVPSALWIRGACCLHGHATSLLFCLVWRARYFCCTHIPRSDALGRCVVSVSVTYPVLVAITTLVEGRRVPVKDSRLAAGSRLIAQ